MDRDPKDAEAEALIDEAFSAGSAERETPSLSNVVAVIPADVIHAEPEEFAAFLGSVFEVGDEVDAVVESSLSPGPGASEPTGRPVHAVVPEALLRRRDIDPAYLLDQVFLAFDEIEHVLSALQRQDKTAAAAVAHQATAVVPEAVIADPLRLLQAIERARNEAEKLELLFRQAKHTLRRLKRYRLSRRTPGTLVSEMRQADEVRTLQYLVEFLHSIHLAADSFEKLELPQPHIREYLEYLYRMEDWDAMAALVQRLEQAVKRYSEG